MWLVGVAFLLLLTCSLCVLVTWRPSQSSAEIWDLPGTSRTYTTVVGALAGFSVTSSIFIANLTVARQSPAFESIIALFLIAFLVFISSAMQFATTPNLAVPAGELYRTVQGYSYVLANASFYLGLSLSWLGLPLLLAAIDLEYLSDVFIWMVLFAILGGAMRVSSSGLNMFSQVELKAGLALPVLCFVTAGTYHLVGTEVIDDLLPARHGSTIFAVLCFAAAAAGFSLQSMMVGALRRESASAYVTRWGRAVLIAFTAAVFSTVSLLWLEVASEVL